MKRKRDLLELTDRLTDGHLDVNVERDSLTQSQFQETISKESGWSHFESIFMVSALHGDGVGDIKVRRDTTRWLLVENTSEETTVASHTAFASVNIFA